MPPAAWAIEELATIDLGDPRRTRRLTRLLSDLGERPGTGIPSACGTAAATKAAYRVLDNDAVAAADIRDAHVAATGERVRGEPLVLAVQDTTTLDFANSAIGGEVRVHSVLAVHPDGAPLGLLAQHVWQRDPATSGKRHTRRQRPTAEKESQRWLDAERATYQAVPAGTRVLTIADQEADIFDLFAQARPATADLLIRVTHPRRIAEAPGLVWDALAATPVGEGVPVAVGRRADREPREALLTLRWRVVTVRPPRNRPDQAALAPVTLTAIVAEEPVPPPGQPAICWRLLTTLPITGGEDALQGVRWYALRWQIERYHYTLKSGCQIEALQLRQVARVERALALYAIVAWRLLWLSALSQTDPDQPCTVALTPQEWPVLWVAIHQRAAVPEHPPSLGEAVRWVAQLGGYLNRASDGPPGVKVLWRGWRRLEDLTAGWRLAQVFSPSSLNPLVGNG